MRLIPPTRRTAIRENTMKNKDPLHVSRRRFLAQLGGLTVAGMLGPSLLTPRSAH
ncbi:twin-arginine translocation signal domain-containing protein, partial [Salmonella enterica subsp. enterica serovar Enteritidis]|nr:twin-arginine translocation signal domain-containing protein [Salmonella enterica subsp. enterica serovar Enteritidis]